MKYELCCSSTISRLQLLFHPTLQNEYCMYGYGWLCMALHGSAWLCMAKYSYLCMYGYAWLCTAMYACMAMHGYVLLCMHVWLCMYVWLCMAMGGYVCYFYWLQKNPAKSIATPTGANSRLLIDYFLRFLAFQHHVKGFHFWSCFHLSQKKLFEKW